VNVALSATDATAGLAALEYSLDGGAWTSGNSLTLPDGAHTLQIRATDTAGNQTMQSATYQVDTLAPTAAITLSGTSGRAGWYTSSVTATANATDSGSGIALVEYQVDGGAWQTGNAITLNTDGAHNVAFRVTDNAGNIFLQSQTVNVDQTAPVSTLTTPSLTALTDGDTLVLSGSSFEAGSGLAYAEISVDGGVTWQALTLSGNVWSFSKTFTEGTYQVVVRAVDTAGNSESAGSGTTINVQPKPSITQAVIDIFVLPVIPTRTATPMATSMPTTTPVPTSTVQPAPSPTATLIAPVVTLAPVVPIQQTPVNPLPIIPAVIALTSVIAYGSLNGGDPRPPAGWKLAGTIDAFNKLNQSR
jgi:hypothetical protein